MSDLAEISDIENESLPAHTAICAQRYKQLDLRLINLETKMDSVQQDILQGQKSLKTTIITSTSTIVASLLGVIVTILMKF
ncbi:hypothetical protein UFOVP322_38 [uncultured Caudovirales phage]|uniref:Uncharacterized protein n=1 Tax=uncultured Caudovirales phage TaxID=2100421 RepID=A0A6J5NQR6_9CAUD|nr:hypothetical protein UFOVP322_38 [uncultured Caudovirales phage]CAB4161132.1 hypothetical protein UFOVP771_36 [uncultured Caudovirales phage]CAB4166532.1 hypothetical protein UFOVP850_36 [uncultured Caudovirales phage]